MSYAEFSKDFSKAKKIVRSCKTIAQAKVAEKYVDLFFKKWQICKPWKIN